MADRAADELLVKRRTFLQQSTLGLGSVALSCLAAPQLLRGAAPAVGLPPGVAGLPHFAPRA
jgi:hypothetical protein